MGRWGTKPWQSDPAADWFAEMMEKTGLMEYVDETLHREIDHDFPGDVDHIRAACTILLLLGHGHVWPYDHVERQLKLAIARLEEILATGYGGCSPQIQAEITILRLRLENKSLDNREQVKWWHFDEQDS